MHLLCVGEAFTDLIFLRMQRIPRAGEELRTGHFAATVGGGAVITAVAASRIGLRARVMSALGPDAVARLRAERVSLVNLIRPGERSAVSVAISTVRDRSFVTFDGVNDQLEGRLWRRLRDIRAPFVHFAFAPRDCARWAAVVRRLQQNGSVTSWDFGWHQNLASRRGFHALAAAVDYLFLNQQEAMMYAGTRTLARAVEAWRTRTRPTIIKLGAAGSRWIGPNLDLHVTGRRRAAVDTTGAGDAFNGGFLAGLARGLAPRDCLRLGNAVGAAVTQKPGGLDGLPAVKSVAPKRRHGGLVSPKRSEGG
jgi:sugar/nucleoside kinase (ribokinase family)